MHAIAGRGIARSRSRACAAEMIGYAGPFTGAPSWPVAVRSPVASTEMLVPPPITFRPATSGVRTLMSTTHWASEPTRAVVGSRERMSMRGRANARPCVGDSARGQLAIDGSQAQPTAEAPVVALSTSSW